MSICLLSSPAKHFWHASVGLRLHNSWIEWKISLMSTWTGKGVQGGCICNLTINKFSVLDLKHLLLKLRLILHHVCIFTL